MSVTDAKHYWRALAIISAIAFTYAAVLVKLSSNWWSDENYSHGLLVPFIVGYILWVQRDKLSSEPGRPSMLLGGLAVVAALFALWIGVAGAELYSQRMSLVLLIAGTVIYFWGVKFLRLVWVPLALLILAIPIPAILFNKIAFPLQLFASRCAVWSMSALGIPVLRQGNVIELKPLNSIDTKKLEVVEACSGIRSLMTLVTLAVVFAYFTHPRSDDGPGKGGTFGFLRSYGFWRSTILVFSAIPIAILTNATRVSGTGILAHYYGTQVADGFFHSFSGWAIYIVAFLLLFGVGWILDRFKPRPKQSIEAIDSIASAGVEDRTTRDHSTGVATSASKVVPAEGAE
ncbi:MAG TPA: exosortase [Pyrinomonadaceae bacterium]|nr:exosortase [Pyrinomonadaceae bacterium]